MVAFDKDQGSHERVIKIGLIMLLKLSFSYYELGVCWVYWGFEPELVHASNSVYM